MTFSRNRFMGKISSNQKILAVRISESLHSQVKMVAARDGMTMQQWVERALEKAISK